MGRAPWWTLVFLVGVGCVAPDEDVDSVDQPFGAHSLYVLGLAPVGYWRLAELSGTTAHDSSTYGFDGTYVNGALLGRAGAIVNDGNDSAQFEERGGNYVNVSDRREHSLTRGWDNWNRTVSRGSSWGTSSGGEPWLAQVSTSDYYGVNGATAYVDLAARAGRGSKDSGRSACWTVIRRSARNGGHTPLTVHSSR